MLEQTFLTVPVSRLGTFRLTCTRCGQAVEGPLRQLHRQGHVCRLCGAELGPEGLAEAFRRLQRAIEVLGQLEVKGTATVAFVIRTTQDRRQAARHHVADLGAVRGRDRGVAQRLCDGRGNSEGYSRAPANQPGRLPDSRR